MFCCSSRKRGIESERCRTAEGGSKGVEGGRSGVVVELVGGRRGRVSLVESLSSSGVPDVLRRRMRWVVVAVEVEVWDDMVLLCY